MQDIIKKTRPRPSDFLETAVPEPPPIVKHRKRRYLGLFGLIGLIAVSQALFLLRPSVAVYASVGTLMAIIAALLIRESFRHIGALLAVVPMLTLLMAVLPIGDHAARIAIYYGSILVFALIYKFFLFKDPPFHSLKIRRNLLPILGLALLGAVCGIGYFFVPGHNYPFETLPLLGMIAGCFVLALSEELFFRGLVQQKALRVVSPMRAVLATAVLYAIMTVGPSLSWGIVWALGFSGLLSFIYRYVPNPLLTFIVNVSAKLAFVIIVSIYT